MSTEPIEDPFGAPLEYVSNNRGYWAICKKCGCGLLGFPLFTQTRRNAVDHLDYYHPSWRCTLPGPRRQLLHKGGKP
jgi:hypothetical protein